MKSIASQITEVTIFPSIASIKRNAIVSLPQGETLVAFERLPETLNEKSVQLTGSGRASMGHVKIEKVHYAEGSNVNVNEIVSQLQAAQDQLNIREDKIQRLTKEMAFVDAITKKITAPTPNAEDAAELDPDKWKKMISFYQEKLEAIQFSIRTTEKEKKAIQDNIEMLRVELERSGTSKPSKLKYRISVSLSHEQAGDVALELSYHVPGAQWYPVYDFRVWSDKRISLSYHAMVSQNSGEDWDDTSIKISTAQPKIHGNQPELSPWHIDFIGSEDYEAPLPSKRMSSMVASAPMPAGAFGGKAEGEPKIKKPTVTVETGATSVTFAISGKHTVKSDGSDTKTTILSEEFTPEFNYSTVPVLQPYAYLKAKIKNHTELPLLAGEANVFLDGNFIAVTKIKTIAPTEEFTVSLGIDEGIKVERKQIKKFEKDGGNLFSKKTTTVLFQYLITIKNFKKTEEEIKVLDQFPISSHDTLKVHLIEPVIKENSDVLKTSEDNIIEWLHKIKAGSEIQIPLKYSIEFPPERKDDIMGINF
jgi:uncharacterized protein (TIGR02231 family)